MITTINKFRKIFESSSQNLIDQAIKVTYEIQNDFGKQGFGYCQVFTYELWKRLNFSKLYEPIEVIKDNEYHCALSIKNTDIIIDPTDTQFNMSDHVHSINDYDEILDSVDDATWRAEQQFEVDKLKRRYNIK